MTYGIYEFALTLPITQAARQTAHTFAREQPTSRKAEQVRLNTLAVLVTQDYLQLMDIPTDLAAGDSWDAVMRVCLDVADLELPGVGRLECRAVQPHADRCLIPAETWEDRVGYIVVEVDEAAQSAQLLGFVPTVEDEELSLSQLRSPEDLLDHLYTLRQSEVGAAPMLRERAQQTLTQLSTWFQTTVQAGEQAIAAGWQTVEQVLGGAELSPAYAFRRAETVVRRAQRVQLSQVAVALVLELRPVEGQTEIRLQVHPLRPQPQLPVDLQLAVLDQTSEILVDAMANGMEDFLELQIEGVAGEAFQVQIQLGADQVTQAFVI